MEHIHQSCNRHMLARAAAALGLAAILAVGIVDQVGGQSLSTIPESIFAATNTASDQTAIQATISRADAEQAQALSASNPQLMADTSTADYLQQVTQANQDLANSGVTAIKLVKVEWGPVSVSGNTATATAYETWTTTLTDGSTLQSRDENDYTLTLDNGAWRVASDDHPNAGAASQPSTSTTPSTRPPTPPSGVSSDASSSNWAGYAAANGNYTAVTGTWTVPAYSSDSSAGVSATWVGIGGVNSRDLIQAGTQEQASGTGQTEYSAWIETLPQASHNVPLRVSPGDSVSVSITEQSTNNWLIAFNNATTGQTYQQKLQYASSHSSAEWIEEAPSAARAGILPLDDFGSVKFSDATVVKNGESESMSAAGATPITLIGANRQALATTSAPGSDGESFTVTRTNAGSTTQASAPSRPRVRVITPGF